MHLMHFSHRLVLGDAILSLDVLFLSGLKFLLLWLRSILTVERLNYLTIGNIVAFQGLPYD